MISIVVLNPSAKGKVGTCYIKNQKKHIPFARHCQTLGTWDSRNFWGDPSVPEHNGLMPSTRNDGMLEYEIVGIRDGNKGSIVFLPFSPSFHYSSRGKVPEFLCNK
jgi:hypothetical protein